MWLTAVDPGWSARWTYSSWKENWLRLIIGAVYIFKGPVNSLLTTGSDFPTGPPYVTALLFHSISTGTLLHQEGTRLHQTTWRLPCVTTWELSYPDPPWYKNQETITSRPPVKPWVLWGTKISSPLFCFRYNSYRQLTGLVAAFCRNTSSVPFNPLNTELNPICPSLASFGAHHILHISR